MTISLNDYLRKQASSQTVASVARPIRQLCIAAVTVHRAIAANGILDSNGSFPIGVPNASGDVQKPLDVFADDAFLNAARQASLRLYASEEREGPICLAGKIPIALAIDPLDGSSNIETNIAVGTIFSLLCIPEGSGMDAVFRQPGERQLAAGFFVYGAQLLLVLTVGSGTPSFIYCPKTGDFRMVVESHTIPPETQEYSINASNRRHWHPETRHYIEDVEAGKGGPRGKDFGMRYAGSLVAETYRILQRGGVFLYPGDRRRGYEEGRLRQLYEANPIAWCIEQAGGAATDGEWRILEKEPFDLHMRTPLAFGSRAEIEIIRQYRTSRNLDVRTPGEFHIAKEASVALTRDAIEDDTCKHRSASPKEPSCDN